MQLLTACCYCCSGTSSWPAMAAFLSILHSRLILLFRFICPLQETWVTQRPQQLQEQHSHFLPECVQYFFVSEQCYGCQCLGLWTRAQVLMHAVARRGWSNNMNQCALKVDSGRRNPLLHWLSALPTYSYRWTASALCTDTEERGPAEKRWA